LSYGNLGYSHHAVQDLAVMRALPGLNVLSPADPGETVECVVHIVAHPGPGYLRLGKAGEKTLHAVRGIAAGPLAVRDAPASPVGLVATGSVLEVALGAAELLARDGGVTAAVYSCPWLKPVTAEFLAPLWRHRILVSLEEHVAEGGLGDLLRRWKPARVDLHTMAIPETVRAQVGSQTYLRRAAGLTAEAAVRAARALLACAPGGLEAAEAARPAVEPRARPMES
jgi:transketolase